MADTSALTIRGPTGAEAQPKLLQVSMTRHETCTVCSDDITIPVYLPRAISDELDRCGMSFQGTIGCIAIYDQQSNGLLQADMFYATNGKDCGASPRSLRSE